jgi:FkbM family methyltransferase
MLWRALRHVEGGFYIDVGANDPIEDSVTKAFYDRGWHGINIEPLPSHYADLVFARTRDINLQCAAADVVGEIELWECDVRGWATASSDVVSQYISKGHLGSYQKVEALPLKDICARYAVEDIHFLKIDVEGFEQAVIDGMNFFLYRPWILVIECISPVSIEEMNFQWETTILSNNYTLAYLDGLNRFYVAKEHSYLIDSFKYPPNVFDDFIRAHQNLAEAKAQEAEAKAQEAEAKAQEAEAKAQQLQTVVQKYYKQISAIHNSTSWRITAPLRWPLHQFRLLRQHGFKARFKSIVKKILSKVLPFIATRPKLKDWSMRLANCLGVNERLKPFVHTILQSKLSEVLTISAGIGKEHLLVDEINLTPRAREIYNDLKMAIAQQHKKVH